MPTWCAYAFEIHRFFRVAKNFVKTDETNESKSKEALIQNILGKKAPKEDFTELIERIKSCEADIEALSLNGVLVEGPVGRLKLAKAYTSSKNFRKADQYSKEAREELDRLKAST